MFRPNRLFKCPPIGGALGTGAAAGTTTSLIAVNSPSLVIPGGLKPQWAFRTYRSGAMPMGDADSKKVEALYAKMTSSGLPSLTEEKVTLSNGHTYDLHFSPHRMTQTNVDTKKSRRMERRLVPESTASPVVRVTGKGGKASAAAKTSVTRRHSQQRSLSSCRPTVTGTLPLPNPAAVDDAIANIMKGRIADVAASGSAFNQRFHSAWDRYYPANSLVTALKAVEALGKGAPRMPVGLRALANAEIGLRRTPSPKALSAFPKKTQTAAIARGGVIRSDQVLKGVYDLVVNRVERSKRKYVTGGGGLASVVCVRNAFARLRKSVRRGEYDAISIVNGSGRSAIKFVDALKEKGVRRKKRISKKN